MSENREGNLVFEGFLENGATVISNKIMNNLNSITSDEFKILAKILQYSQLGMKISKKIIIDETGISSDKIDNSLKRLIELGYIKNIGGDSNEQ